MTTACWSTSLLGEPDHAAQLAVDVDIELRIVERLLDARIGHARNMPNLAQQLLGEGAVGLRSAPATCTSIGAGEPKFRIWLTMSAGRNEKVVPGNALRQLLAQLLDIGRGRRRASR